MTREDKSKLDLGAMSQRPQSAHGPSSLRQLSHELRSHRWFVMLFTALALVAVAFGVWCASLFNAAGTLREAGLSSQFRLLTVAALLLVAVSLGLAILSYVSWLRLQRAQFEIQRRGSHDVLTGLLNRSGILEVLDKELVRVVRLREDLAICLIDLDHFNDVNVQLGVAAGDTVLQETSQQIADQVRPYDSIGRYGGEELLVVVPGCKRAGAMALGERIRKSVELHTVEIGPDQVSVSVSIGVATCGPEENNRSDDLIHLAEQALKEAKDTGRNRVVSIRLPA